MVMAGPRQEHRVRGASGLVHRDGGGEVHVVADGSEVTITGPCDEVDVVGSGTTVTLSTADDLDVEGDRNTVTAGTVREMDISGDGNTVRVATTRDIDVEGDDNVVTFGAGDPVVDDEGRGNSISRG